MTILGRFRFTVPAAGIMLASMPLDTETLENIARDYVASMTSIRGRRVHRLFMREFSRFDRVVPVRTADGSDALLAAGNDGSAALCRTDGRGAVACIHAWGGLDAPEITTCYDLKRDSLPVVTRSVGDANLKGVAGMLTISRVDLPKLSGTPIHQLFETP
jgi:hypothetical protein